MIFLDALEYSDDASDLEDMTEDALECFPEPFVTIFAACDVEILLSPSISEKLLADSIDFWDTSDRLDEEVDLLEAVDVFFDSFLANELSFIVFSSPSELSLSSFNAPWILKLFAY